MKNMPLYLLLTGFTLSCQTEKNIPIDVLELTVSGIHEAYANGIYTSEELVNAYIQRIDALDKSTKLNSIIRINPEAISIAKALDTEFRKSGELRPLHGIPVIVKDNYQTTGLTTTAGSIALKNWVPQENAYQIQKLIDAGAIVLAKSNMAEWAFSPMHSNSSILGMTLNPYNLNHTPAGSSGGTAAAVAANFGTIGLGTDTGNSIRGPSSHNALVGFRSTIGLTSRHGIAPLYLRNDIGGPMCRTVEDATRILQAISGYDKKDPITRNSTGRMPEDYLAHLQMDGLEGKKIGVLRILTQDIHPEVNALFDQTIDQMKELGAQVVDPFIVPDFDSLRRNQWCSEFKKDIEVFLAENVKDPDLRTLEDLITAGEATPYAQTRMQHFLEVEARRGDPLPCGNAYDDPRRIAFRGAIERAMDSLELDAIIYPSWNYPPATIGNFSEEYLGDNSQIIAPHTGQPAFTVPMGFLSGDLPSGLQILGRMFDEPTLIEIAYAYEQATQHRQPPKDFDTLSK